MTTRTIEQRAVGDLHGHPEQQDLIGDVSDGELNDLVKSIQRDGLQHPIEILPDGTVVAGHQRLRAAKRLGLTEVSVRVRVDLAQAGDDAVVAYLIQDNRHRPTNRGCAARVRRERTNSLFDGTVSISKTELKRFLIAYRPTPPVRLLGTSNRRTVKKLMEALTKRPSTVQITMTDTAMVQIDEFQLACEYQPSANANQRCQ